MAALITREVFGGQTHGTVPTTSTIANLDAVQGSGTLLQHVTSPNVIGGGTALAALAETASKYCVWQKASRAFTGITFIGLMTDLPGATAFVFELRATSTSVAAQLKLDTAGGLQPRNGTTAVGSTLQLPLGQRFRIDWSCAVSGTTQTLRLYTGNKIDSTDTNDAEASTSGTYTSGNMDYVRVGNIAAVAGGVSFLWTEMSVDDAVIPAPTFLLPRAARPPAVMAA